MKKLLLFALVGYFFIGFLHAQTITQVKGLSKVVFNTAYGEKTIYLPGDIRPGEAISGSVADMPAGNKQKAISQNAAALKNLRVSINGLTVSGNQSSFSFTAASAYDVQLSDGKNILQAANATPSSFVSAANQFGIPTHALTGTPLRITGPFDGDAQNTKCNLSGQPLEVLAESKNQCIVMFPADAKGMQELTIIENGKQHSTKISSVNLDVSAGRLSLTKGESTFIDVLITGLQSLPDTAVLTVTNLSNTVVTMENGNLQTIVLPPAKDTGEYTFSRRFTVQSIRTGNYSVNVNLDLPETDQEDQGGTTKTGGHPGEITVQCECEGSCSIKKVETKGDHVSFIAVVTAVCKGTQCPPPVVTFKWYIGESGKDVAGIDGIDYASSVTVKTKKPGAYNLYLKITITCGGSICERICSSEETVPPGHPPTTTECGLRYEWCAGPAIKVEKIGFYPDDKEVLKDMRPGELIGLSALASDLDYLLQYCLCPEGEETKRHPLTPDDVLYDWEFENLAFKESHRESHGKIISKPDEHSNSILYQLPFCYEDFPLHDKIILTIYNKKHKAKDEQVQIEFTISVTLRLPYYKEKVKKTYGLDIYLKAKQVNAPADVTCVETSGGDCVVMPPVWTMGNKLAFTKVITLHRPAERPPDNLLVLQADADDADSLTLTCFHKKTGQTIIEILPAVFDGSQITWKVVKGTGSFPLGDKGAAVVFVHNYLPAAADGSSTNEVQIECRVTDSKMQFTDPDPAALASPGIKPRIQPAAFVGLGDIHYIGSTEHGELLEAAKIAVKNYEKAGYNVFTDFECTKPSLERMYKNPAGQAVLVIGHGTVDGMAMVGGKDHFLPTDIRLWSMDKWKCLSTHNHPFSRELILLGCNVGEGEADWYEKYFRLEKFYGRKDWVWSSAAFSSILKYVKEEHKPLAPRIPDR